MGRTRPCDPAIGRGRLRKAIQFLDAANLVQEPDDGSSADVFVTLCVHAGIAAADAICCARLGEHAQGDSHHEAVELLRKADKGAAGHLGTLLGMKSKAAYGYAPATDDERKRAGRAAEALTETARRAAAG
jgi:hypothetical protein